MISHRGESAVSHLVLVMGLLLYLLRKGVSLFINKQMVYVVEAEDTKSSKNSHPVNGL
jgi:hypothetical protein